jgi:hypothetical protein
VFCIAAFIILGILGIFSARYRRLAAEAWKCVARKTTFRKCDTNFKEDLKSRLLSGLAVHRPRLARFFEKWIEVLAFIFVILAIWSLLTVLRSGLNLYVYDTCNPGHPESCTLSAQACSIDSNYPSFWHSLRTGHLLSWGHNDIKQFVDTIERIPDRMKKWQPLSYTSKTSSYYYAFNPSKPTALEIVDPGCEFCAQLFRNMQAAGIENRYNLTYIAYPIPNPNSNTYKFANSFLIASYLEAIRTQPLSGLKTPADWQILQRIFSWQDPDHIIYQSRIDYVYTGAQVEALLQKWLGQIGYSDQQVQSIVFATKSQAVKSAIAQDRQTVEQQIKTVKIPTLLLGSRRYDGVVDTKALQSH